MRQRVRAVAAIFASLFLLAACVKPASQSSATSGVTVGDDAPAFTLPSADGGAVSLADFRGHKPVLLYFSMGPG
jgi:cytochrome oxidase Cu insertion factor (SCO1/SenC/PrrC family)